MFSDHCRCGRKCNSLRRRNCRRNSSPYPARCDCDGRSRQADGCWMSLWHCNRRQIAPSRHPSLEKRISAGAAGSPSDDVELKAKLPRDGAGGADGRNRARLWCCKNCRKPTNYQTRSGRRCSLCCFVTLQSRKKGNFNQFKF